MRWAQLLTVVTFFATGLVLGGSIVDSSWRARMDVSREHRRLLEAKVVRLEEDLRESRRIVELMLAGRPEVAR